jgi:hypothetical protein
MKGNRMPTISDWAAEARVLEAKVRDWRALRQKTGFGEICSAAPITSTDACASEQTWDAIGQQAAMAIGAMSGAGIIRQHTDARLEILRKEEIAMAVRTAVTEERLRVIALLNKIKPGEQPYSRKEWRDEQKGEMRMWERMVKAITEPAKPHRD